MTLMDAPAYDPAPARRRRIKIGVGVFLLLLTTFLVWLYRYWPEEHKVDKFFTSIQNKDYETAYGLWMNDPAWKQHPQQHARYPFNEFYTDWGPGGEWGLVKSHKIRASGECRGGGSGIVVEIIVNDRVTPARVWVEKSDKTLSYPPC